MVTKIKEYALNNKVVTLLAILLSMNIGWEINSYSNASRYQDYTLDLVGRHYDIELEISELKSKLSRLKSEISDINMETSKLESKISDTDMNVGQLNAEVSNMDDKIFNLETRIMFLK